MATNFKKLDYGEVIRTLTDNLGSVTKQQLTEIINKELIWMGSNFRCKEEILMRSIQREKKQSQYRTEATASGKDLIISPYSKQPDYNMIRCIWVLLDMLKEERVDISMIFKGKRPETMLYTTDNISYSFYFIDDNTIGTIPQSVKDAKYFEEMTERTRDHKFYVINIYVTDSIDIADEITRMNLDIPHMTAVIRKGASAVDKPIEVGYIKDGKRTK